MSATSGLRALTKSVSNWANDDCTTRRWPAIRSALISSARAAAAWRDHLEVVRESRHAGAHGVEQLFGGRTAREGLGQPFQPRLVILEQHRFLGREVSEKGASSDTGFPGQLGHGDAAKALARFLPDKQKHTVMRGMLAFLAVNSTYRGIYTPGSATCLAFGFAVPDDSTAMLTKLKGGIGALTEHLRDLFVSPRR